MHFINAGPGLGQYLKASGRIEFQLAKPAVSGNLIKGGQIGILLGTDHRMQLRHDDDIRQLR